MALLRTLTDDILSRSPQLAQDISGRGEKLYELSKAKRAAVMKFNKVRLAYEGPRKPSKPKKSEGNDGKDESGEGEDVGEPMEEEKPFVPTATKKQFEQAEKAKIKAIEAYESSIGKLISRTQPIAFDRKYNSIYFFRQDPSMLHIEQLKQGVTIPPEIKALRRENIPFSSWHVIDTKPLYEQFLSSLDGRGIRENEAIVELSLLTVLKRNLLDEKKENTRAQARVREMEALERRLENAKSACDAEDGRRSGRLAGMAQSELQSVEIEIKELIDAHKEEERQEKLGREKASDYALLTGLQSIEELAGAGQRATRSTKMANAVENEGDVLASIPASKLWMNDKIGGNGTLHILVDALLGLETKCNNLVGWTRQDISRADWRKQLSEASDGWAIDCAMQLGPSAGDSPQADDTAGEQSPTKRQKTETASGTSLASLVTSIKVSCASLNSASLSQLPHAVSFS